MRKIISLIIIALIHSATVMADEPPYHNLINGELTGEVAEKEVMKFAREFKQHTEGGERLLPLYERYIDKIGVKSIATVLETDSLSCHGVAHSLGRIIGTRVEDLKAGMKICGSTCTYACLHALFQVYFNKLGKDYHEHSEHHDNHQTHEMHVDNTENQVIFTDSELKQFSRDANIACKKSDSIVDGFFQGNCAHGIGHALAKLGDNAVLANSYCKIFRHPDMQYYCETGVFMELGSQLEDTLFADTRKRSEEIRIALSYCSKESNYPASCLRFLLPRNNSLGHITRYAFFCTKQRGLMKAHCFNSLGFHSRTYVAKNPSEIVYTCSMGDMKDQAACISGIALMKKGQRHREKIKSACLLLDSDIQKKFCGDQVSKYYYHLENDYFSRLMITSQ